MPPTKKAKAYKAAKAIPAPAKQTSAGRHSAGSTITKTRFTSVRLSHSDPKPAAAAKTGSHLKHKKSGKENKTPSGTISMNGISNGKNAGKMAANAAAQAHSNGRVGKASGKVNAVSKAAGSSNRKVAGVKKTNAGSKASAKVAGEKKTSTVKSQKAYSTLEKTSKYRADRLAAETKGVFRLKPITNPMARKTKSPAHTPSAAVKSMLKQSPPFAKSAVSGVAFSAPEKPKTKSTNAYKQVHNHEPMSAVQIFISNLIVKQLKSCSQK